MSAATRVACPSMTTGKGLGRGALPYPLVCECSLGTEAVGGISVFCHGHGQALDKPSSAWVLGSALRVVSDVSAAAARMPCSGQQRSHMSPRSCPRRGEWSCDVECHSNDRMVLHWFAFIGDPGHSAEHIRIDTSLLQGAAPQSRPHWNRAM